MIKKIVLILPLILPLKAQAADVRLSDTLIVHNASLEMLEPIEPSYLENITSARIWKDNWFMGISGGTSAFVGSPLGCADLLEIEGLLDLYKNRLKKEEKKDFSKKPYPKNDYSGLNSLCSRLQGIQWLDNSLENYKLGSSSEYGSSVQSYLTELSKGKSCIGAPIFFFFELGTNHLTDASQLVNLDEIARIAKQYNLNIRICGAADSATGTADVNRNLGASRSEYIYSQLLHRGIDKNKISKVNKEGIDTYKPKEANRHTSVMLFLE